MDSASENEELSANFLGETHQYLVASADDTEDSRDGEDGERSNNVLREQDRFLPIANVARLMKKSIPKTGKIAKDARECVQECVSEFVSFITSEASDRCHQEKRKTINGEDILFAMSSLGFDNYVEPLKLYLQKYREAMKGDKSLSMPESYQISNLNGEVTDEMLQQQQQQQQQQEGQTQGVTVATTTTATTELESEGVIFTYAPVNTDPLTSTAEFNLV